jgi:pentatricopeptide repeat protein
MSSYILIFVELINACANLGALEGCIYVYKQIIQRCCEFDVRVEEYLGNKYVCKMLYFKKCNEKEHDKFRFVICINMHVLA